MNKKYEIFKKIQINSKSQTDQEQLQMMSSILGENKKPLKKVPFLKHTGQFSKHLSMEKISIIFLNLLMTNFSLYF